MLSGPSPQELLDEARARSRCPSRVTAENPARPTTHPDESITDVVSVRSSGVIFAGRYSPHLTSAALCGIHNSGYSSPSSLLPYLQPLEDTTNPSRLQPRGRCIGVLGELWADSLQMWLPIIAFACRGQTAVLRAAGLYRRKEGCWGPGDRADRIRPYHTKSYRNPVRIRLSGLRSR